MKVPLSDASNRSLNIHYLCDGPKNSSHATFVFEGGTSNTHIDYLALQKLLTKEGRRSCIWDKAGAGYSDFLFADMAGNYSLYYDTFVRQLAAMGELTPFIWVAWGDGGSLVYEYATKSPDMVASITYLDAYPPQFEWTSRAFVNNLTNNQINSFINLDMIKRYVNKS